MFAVLNQLLFNKKLKLALKFTEQIWAIVTNSIEVGLLQY